MGITDVLALLGGLALFLYGMQMMSTGLEAAAGNRMKSILEKLTSNRVKGVLVGAAITAVIQSSSATTVMVVGFVNSGLMTLKQAVWVIMGANIGTTITGQLIALDIGAIAPLFAIAGVGAIMFIKSETVHHISSIFAGLGILFMGMDMMGAAMSPLKESEAFISLMTKFDNPLLGILVGALFTAVIQSSSATTVMVIGFVNSGMMKLKQAIGIIMGANIGTSITGWILCLSYIDGKNGIAKILSTATISAVVAIIGIILRMACKRSVHKNIGNIMLGFAILMTGMQTMSGAVSPLKDSPTFTNMLTMFSNPLIGILVGIAFTAVLQSASATVGVLQALSVTGILTFSSAFPIVLGIGVGAACPVLISAIGANKNGKRTALVYLINDLFGLILWSVIFYTVNAVVHFGFMDMIMSPVAIALLNTVFRVATVCVLFPFIPKIEQLVCWLVKDSAEELEDEADFDLLEERLLNYPALAIGQCHRAMSGMARKLRKNVNRAMNLLNEYQQDKFDKVQRKENLIDKYESRLGEYLMKLTKHEMNSAQTRQASLYLHTINDFERIGDHASYIAYMSSEMHDNHTNFSQEAWDELNVVMEAVREEINLTCRAFLNDDKEMAQRVAPLGMIITSLCNELKMHHVERLSNGNCGLEEGTVYTDILNSFNRIAAHCASAMVALLKSGDENPDMHIHDSKIYPSDSVEYYTYFKEYRQKYEIVKNEEHMRSMEPEEVE